MKKCAQITIHGKVQNVGFRYNTRIIAKEYGIAGYVKNMPDGTVFTEAEGEESNLERFIEYCKKGPDWAHVEKTDIHYVAAKGYSDFKIR